MLQMKTVHSVKTLKSQTSMEIQLGSLTSCVPSLLPLVMLWAGWETPWQNDGKVRFSKKHLSQTSLEIHTLSRAHTHYLMLQSCSQMGNICCSVMGNNTFCNSGGSALLFKEAQFLSSSHKSCHHSGLNSNRLSKERKMFGKIFTPPPPPFSLTFGEQPTTSSHSSMFHSF